MTALPRDNEPTDEEIAAAIAAVRLMLRRRGRRDGGGSRWMQAGRVEALMPPPRAAGWTGDRRGPPQGVRNRGASPQGEAGWGAVERPR